MLFIATFSATPCAIFAAAYAVAAADYDAAISLCYASYARRAPLATPRRLHCRHYVIAATPLSIASITLYAYARFSLICRLMPLFRRQRHAGYA